MRILFLLFFISCTVTGLYAQQGVERQQRHEINQASNTEQVRFSIKVEQLRVAIVSEDIVAMITLQKELLAFIRHFEEQPEHTERCRQTLEAFEGFSFHNASAAERELKMNLLEGIRQIIAP